MASDKTISLSIDALVNTLSLTDTSVSLQKPIKNKPTHQEIPLRNILSATFTSETRLVKVSYLYKAKKKQPFHLLVLEGEVKDEAAEKASEWVEAVSNAAYLGVKRSRRLLVFVNPHGGTKQGAAVFTNKVYPIFKAAGCTLEVIHTTRQGHAYDVVKTLSLEYDAIITVSGDGLIHEVLNGLGQHADPLRALATPVAPIPTGSGNGLSLNLLGIEEGFDVSAAALNAIKGRPMKVDLFSLTQGEKRSISFMSQTLGLMAELDIGTESLRWMGDSRFWIGLVRGIVKYKECPIELSYKVAEVDKHAMAESAYSRTQELAKLSQSPLSSEQPSSEVPYENTLPPLQYSSDDEGWITFKEPILYVYAGKGPYVGRDFMAFPVSLPDDGLVDITVMTNNSRGDILAAMDGAEKGASYWHPKVHYVKAHAYRVKPLKKKGHMAVDGEYFPFEEFQVEVHRGLGTLLSLYGHYVAPFEPKARTPK